MAGEDSELEELPSWITMCKSGGTGNVEKTISNQAHQDEIEDIDNGLSLVNIHHNTLMGTSTTLVVVIGILVCFCVVCAKPLLHTWRMSHQCCRDGGVVDGRLTWQGDCIGGREMSVGQTWSQGHQGAIQAPVMMRPHMGSLPGQDRYRSDVPFYGHPRGSLPLLDRYPTSKGPICDTFERPVGGAEVKGGGGEGIGKRSPM